MSFRSILIALLLAITGAAATFGVAQLAGTIGALTGVAGILVGGMTLAALRQSGQIRDVKLLREHLDVTRQHAALLARHTRELRDTYTQTYQAFAEARNGEAQSGDHAMKTGELAVLSGLVRDIADSVAALERRNTAFDAQMAELRRAQSAQNGGGQAGTGWIAPAKAAVPDMARPQAAAPQIRDIPAPPTMTELREPPRIVRQHVAAAIAADRFDLYLQRIVRLPQRRIRAYDITLRPDGGDSSLSNTDIRNAVEAVGHQLAFDRKLMIQAIRLARAFETRDRDALLFVDISQRYLMSEAAFDELSALLADAPSVSQRLVLALPQRFFRKAVAFEHEALRNLHELGFRFAMREMEDFNLDAPRLAKMGVRWLRMDGQTFLTLVQNTETVMEVAVADVMALLNRQRLSFIADEISAEASIAELIDLNVEFAQGIAFAPPQAVRSEALDLHASAKADMLAEPRSATSAVSERRGLRDLARRA